MLQPNNDNHLKTYLKYSMQNSGTVMLFVIILSFISSLVLGSMSLSNRYSLKLNVRNRQKVQALFVAEAGKERILAKLRYKELLPDANTKINVFDNVWLDSAGTYTVTCSTNTANNRALIRSTGKTVSDSVVLEVLAALGPVGSSGSGWIRGTVTAKHDIETSGNIIVDGRNHDTIGDYGNLTGSGDIYGVASGGTVKTQSGSTLIGGTTTAPQNTVLPGVTVQENMDISGYPTTPEQVLGLPPGSLDTYKMDVGDKPDEDFYGIVYYDESLKQKELPEFKGGILIVHNDTRTASIANFHGHFKGLIIADQIKHVNATSTLLGAFFLLGDTNGGNAFGNGAAAISYSSESLAKAFSLPVFSSSDKRAVTVESWREIN